MCSFTQALCLTEQPPHVTSAATSAAADGSHESLPSHVHWQGLLLYDITKISSYRDAFSDLPVSEEEDSDALWLSQEARGALRRVRGGRGPALRDQERERGSSVTRSNAAIC